MLAWVFCSPFSFFFFFENSQCEEFNVKRLLYYAWVNQVCTTYIFTLHKRLNEFESDWNVGIQMAEYCTIKKGKKGNRHALTPTHINTQAHKYVRCKTSSLSIKSNWIYYNLERKTCNFFGVSWYSCAKLLSLLPVRALLFWSIMCLLFTIY